MMNINFDATYDDYLLNKVYDKIVEFSACTLYLEIDTKTFEELLSKTFGKFDSYEKTDYSYIKSVNNLEPYTYKACINENIAVMYNVNNMNEDSVEKENFDYDKDAVWISSSFSFYYKRELADKVKSFIKEMKANIQKQTIKNRFYTIGADANGFILQAENVAEFDVNIELNYGSKFKSVHDEIYDVLKNQFSGLLLLHGEPGTGKTTYIRYLISMLCNNKTIIYVPAYMIEQIANPEFITFIQRYKESILILEDAEFALQQRSDEYGAQAVSNLLNITNGLLNDVTKMQVIATFNMDRKNIDKALLRPGRLLKEWKFDKLAIEDAKALAQSLNKDLNITAPMTIAEIYSGKTQARKAKKRIGIKDEE